jgi:hypothetical protein
MVSVDNSMQVPTDERLKPSTREFSYIFQHSTEQKSLFCATEFRSGCDEKVMFSKPSDDIPLTQTESLIRFLFMGKMKNY